MSFFQAALASSGTRLANATTAAFKAKVAAAEDKKKARITIYKDETLVIFFESRITDKTDETFLFLGPLDHRRVQE